MSAKTTAEILFNRHFRNQPEGLWSAPGRANLIGEHTDYNDGLALPFAINDRTYVAVSRRPDRVIRVVSMANPDQVVQWSLDGDTPTGLDWASYPLGVLSLMATTTSPGLSIAIASDVPSGAGLSSSAALECSVAIAARDLWHTPHSAQDLADIGTRAENDIVGAPTGTMDQLASMLGTADHAVSIDFHHRTTHPVPLRVTDHGLTLVVIDSGQRHDHATGGYGERRRVCESVRSTLGVASLRDLTVENLPDHAPSLNGEQARLMAHVVSENSRVTETIDALNTVDFVQVGKQLTSSHQSLRDSFRVSTDYIDSLVDTCLATGALGARLCGGGFGGSVIALIPQDMVGMLKQVLNSGDKAPNTTQRPILRIVTPSNGASQE